MDYQEYCARLQAEGGTFREAALAAGPDTPVPSCPEWSVSRLVGHLARAYELATAAVTAGEDAGRPSTSRPPQGWDAVLAHHDERLTALLDALRTADPQTPAWHFSPTAPKTVAFWARRTAHDATVHRIDAQLAAGQDGPVDPGFAADGIDDVLTRLIQRRLEFWSTAQLSGTVLYHAADAGRAWTVRLVPGQLPQTSPETVVEPSASVVGLADSVYRAAWGRPSRATISGDAELVAVTRGR